jgi:signal transduction histidine kinase
LYEQKLMGRRKEKMSEFNIPWQALVEMTPDGLFVLDTDGAAQYANTAALNLLGRPAPKGAPVAAWLAGLNELDELLEAIEKRGQARLYLPSAKHKHLLFEATPLGGTDGTLCHIRRDYEVEASDIIGFTAHELRKPMTSIMGYPKLMLTVGGDTLNEMQRQFLEVIERNVQRLERDLAAVLDMSRVDQGRVQLDFFPQSPAKAIAQVLKALQPLVEEKGHHVTLDLPDDLPAVRADAMRFQQILRILLDNALKYTSQGGEVSVRGHAADDLVQIDVADNGLGIPPAEQEKIFTRFFRGEDERICEAYTGLGLGLYIAQRLVELQGGRLWFESTEGQGSTFSFALPVFEGE